MEKFNLEEEQPKGKFYEGITSEKITLKNEQTVEDFLANEKLHIDQKILDKIKDKSREIKGIKIDLQKHVLHDEMYDSEVFKKLDISPYTMKEFLITLAGLLEEKDTFHSELNIDGTRDEPPANIFFVNYNDKVKNFTLWQDKNSDGNTFLDWFLSKRNIGESKLSPGTTVFSK